MILEGIRVSTDMDPDTEALLAFPHDSLYGQFNYAVLLLTAMFFVNFLLSLLTRGVKMELVINIVVKGRYNDKLLVSQQLSYNTKMHTIVG